MKISIVMAYYNRMQQLFLTLKSIRRQNRNVEIVIVDDNSDPSKSASKVVSYFPDMDIKLIYLHKEDRTGINPCVPFNIGFDRAEGEIIVLQSPECLHVGNILEFVQRNISSKHYLAFSCYNLSEQTHSVLGTYLTLSDYDLEDAMRAFIPLNDSSSDADTRREDGCWFNHPVYCPKNYHFFSALTRENLEDLGGFDERYAEGYCWDDNEFLWRVKQKGLKVECISPSQGLVVHQWHEHGPLLGGCPEWDRNKKLFEEVTRKSNTYKVNCLEKK